MSKLRYEGEKVSGINYYSRAIVLEEFEKLNLPKNIKIADIGCGKGSFLLELQKRGYRNLSGSDINRHNNLPANIHFKKGDFHQGLPYDSNEFDMAFSLEVIEHLENPWRFIDEIHRILKKGGFAIITTPNPDNLTSKILFLFGGRFNHFGKNLSYDFNERKIRSDKHRTPVFHLFFQEMIYRKFRLVSYKANGVQPLFSGKEIYLGTKTPFIGMNKIYCLQKI